MQIALFHFISISSLTTIILALSFVFCWSKEADVAWTQLLYGGCCSPQLAAWEEQSPAGSWAAGDAAAKEPGRARAAIGTLAHQGHQP